MGFGRSLRGTPGDSRMFAGLRGARLRPARLKRAEERRNDNRSKPLFRTLRCIPFSDCYTTPAAGNRHREDGVLVGVGSDGEIWGSSAFLIGSVSASSVCFLAGTVYPFGSPGRARGYAVRCVQNLSKLLLVPIRTAPKQPGWAAFPALNLQSTEPPPTQ